MKLHHKGAVASLLIACRRWEQSSKYGESEVIVRFALAAPATKKDVKVVFKAAALQVSVAGEELINGKLFGGIQIDDCTWCLVEKGSELQVLLALAGMLVDKPVHPCLRIPEAWPWSSGLPAARTPL